MLTFILFLNTKDTITVRPKAMQHKKKTTDFTQILQY